jgi:hypothetical protein
MAVDGAGGWLAGCDAIVALPTAVLTGRLELIRPQSKIEWAAAA